VDPSSELSLFPFAAGWMGEKAWAFKSDPFTWHQDEHNPVFSPGKPGWDSGSIRLDAVFYLAEADAWLRTHLHPRPANGRGNYALIAGTIVRWGSRRLPRRNAGSAGRRTSRESLDD
jgi:hypothetical protein